MMSASERLVMAHTAHMKAQPTGARRHINYLHKSMTRRHGRTGQCLRVLAGRAWITLDGRDILLRAGEDYRLNAGTFDAVVSSADGRALVYELS
jgi:mannose-6-phosphate isomerase-like protein (cupin superfamily)